MLLESLQISPTQRRVDLKAGETTRTYWIQSPTALASKPFPILFAFHGGGGFGKYMGAFSGFDKMVDQEQFILVCPEGIRHRWNDMREEEIQSRDTEFFLSIVEDLGQTTPMDHRAVYCCGISNGGMFAQRLALELGRDHIAGIASVAGALPTRLMETFPHGSGSIATVPVLLMPGRDDPLVRWEGGEVFIPWENRIRGKVESFEETLKFWLNRNQCETSPVKEQVHDATPDDGMRAIEKRYQGGSEVLVFELEGAGHTWPGGFQYLDEKWIGKTSRDVNASQEIWNFFRDPV
jgi:polyhydroxybutyrate depolymerase